MVRRPASGAERRAWSRLLAGCRRTRKGTPKGPFRFGSVGPIDAHDRLAQRTGQVQRSGVAGDHQARAAGDGDETLQRKLRRLGHSAARFDDLGRNLLLAGARIHQHPVAGLVQFGGNGSIAARRPALRTPSGAGTHQHHRAGDGLVPIVLLPILSLALFHVQQAVRPSFRLGGHREQGERGFELFPYDCLTNLDGLLDDVRAGGRNTLAKQPSRRPLARLILAEQPRRAGSAREPCRTDRSLQIDAYVVALRAQFRAHRANLS